MTTHVLLRIMSLLSIVLMSLHITDDIVRGISPARADNLGAVVIFVIWLAGTVLPGDRRSGYVVMLLGGVFAAAMPVLHMTGESYPAIAKSSGGFFFIWSLIAVGTTGALSVILSLTAIWRSFRSGPAAVR